MNRIINLFHVSMQADDYDSTLDFYRDKLGFQQMFELKVKDFREILHFTDSDINNDLKWLTYLRVAPGQYLEVFNGIINPPEFEPEKTDKSRGTVSHSIAFGCYDVEKTIAALKEKGVPVENGYITDPSGFKIRIVQYDRPDGAGKDRLFNSLAGTSLYVNDLAYMSEFVSGMGMIKTGETRSAALFSLGEEDQYLELVQTPVKIDTGDEDMLGHLALQVSNISDLIWEFGNAGVRTCLQPGMRDQPFEVKKGIPGNIAADGCEIVWAVSKEGNRFELMYQDGNTLQQQWESKNPF